MSIPKTKDTEYNRGRVVVVFRGGAQHLGPVWRSVSTGGGGGG